MKRRIVSLALVALVAFSLVACSQKPSSSGETSSKSYASILEASRPAADNTAYHIIGSTAPNEAPTILFDALGIDKADYASQAEMFMQVLGLDPATLDQFALSASLMNTRVYGIGILKPAEGQADTVLNAVNAFVVAQQKAFENYLPDQYEISKKAIVESLPSGEILLVMAEGGDDIAKKIKDALK